MANAQQIDFLNAGMGTAYGLGWVYTYESGTTTNKTVYTAADKSANAANPFQLDANGRATVYAAGNYTLVIKDVNLANAITLNNMYYGIPATTNKTVTSVSADYTATSTDFLILVNTASGAVPISLLTAIGNEGLEFIIIKTSADANAVTVDPYGTQSISGSSTITIPTQHETLKIISNNSNWVMTSSPGAVTLTGTQTLTNKTLTSPVLTGPIMTVPQIQDTSSDHQYVFAVNELAADRTVTMPLLLAGDELVFKNHIVTLVGKTLTTPVINSYALLKGIIQGLTVSHDTDTDHDIAIAAGATYDATGAVEMILASALIKKADATWAVGSTNGGMATGESLPTSGTINLWLIKRSDTGVVDAMFNNHATTGLTPTLPTDYDYKRLIKQYRTDGSANIINGVQWGTGCLRKFMYNTPPALDVDDDNPGTAAVTRALSVPIGKKVLAIFNGVSIQGNAASVPQPYFSDLDNADLAPSTSASPLAQGSAANIAFGPIEVLTNTSGQIRSRVTDSGTTSYLRISTLGYWEAL